MRWFGGSLEQRFHVKRSTRVSVVRWCYAGGFTWNLCPGWALLVVASSVSRGTFERLGRYSSPPRWFHEESWSWLAVARFRLGGFTWNL